MQIAVCKNILKAIYRPALIPNKAVFPIFMQFLTYFYTIFMFRWSKSHASCSVGGGCTLEVDSVSITSEVTFGAGTIHYYCIQGVNFGMELGICDLAMVAGSTAGNLFPSLADSC